ncbi:MAG: TonB-dependent receptor [Bacteroidales bacterium]|nr:TonB-dependent receptor [Bacteroidales bacterium]
MMKRVAWMLTMSLWALSAFSQYTISGEVADEQNQPLPGANLVITELNKGAVSSGNGTFRIENIPAGSYVLTLTFVGYEPRVEYINVKADMRLGEMAMKLASLMVEEVMVTATRAGEKTPVAFTNLDREEIASRNFGQDVPFLLSMTPSLVTSSDAGHGIGYTSMRIRGTDANRINVTINGIPLNDAESHSVYWVDLPDVATSVDNIQIQRGVGTSTNGAAAFGASVNLMTRKVEKEPYATYEATMGAFRTYRNAISAGTGLIKDHFAVDLRLSDMHSEGYMDRSWTDLQSYYASAGYYDAKTMVKFITFSGKEELYQAWNGVPSTLLETDRTYNELGGYTDSDGNPAYYDNQVDHYKQDHYQLHLTHEFSPGLHANAALHYTKGAGYYEQYKEDEALSDYQLDDLIIGGEPIVESDLIRRKWLDNDFFGMVGGVHYQDERIGAVLGGGWNRYDGDHFGTVIWARYPGGSEIRHRWYENQGMKTDWNSYLKTSIQAGDRLSFFADLQVRGIEYGIGGIDDDLRDITQQHNYLFFNPKAGLNFQMDPRQRAYLFLARANREPNRSNFVDADPSGPLPVQEALMDFEAGYSFQGEDRTFNANFYFMDYTNQLVLTGEINDVGSAVMTNVKDSYRAGIELAGGARLTNWLRWDVNATFSSNKILNYVGYVDNWDYWNDPESEPYQLEEDLGTTDLSFSPGMIFNSQIDVEPLKHLHLNLSSRYVGGQFIDNISSLDRSLDPYFINDVRISYAIYPKFVNELSLHLQLLNLLNVEYETNAWIYRYYFEGEHGVMDGFYPQAGFHLMAGVRLSF